MRVSMCEYVCVCNLCSMSVCVHVHVCVIYVLVVVVLFSEIHVFSFPHHPRLLATIQTTPNPQGLWSTVCSSVDCQVMVYPGHQRGAIQIVVS